jgi:hypothetical protein
VAAEMVVGICAAVTGILVAVGRLGRRVVVEHHEEGDIAAEIRRSEAHQKL